jgi:hypothetical protein
MSWDKNVTLYKISGEKLRNILADFDDCVSLSHSYKRIPYNIWRNLKHQSTLVNRVYEVEFDDEIEQIRIFKEGAEIFEYGDKSFGSFLVDNFEEYFESDSPYETYCDVDGTEKKVKKENGNMVNGLKFDFGPCTNDNVKISMYGLAVRNNAGTWVSYNRTSGEIVDVDIFNFDGGNFLFKMPVAIKEIKAGDIVIHNKVPVFVTGVENGKLAVVDVRAGEEKSIIPTKNMFGFDFITKVVSVLDAVQGAPTPNEPFGNMLPFLMLQDGKMDKNMALMLMMNQGNNAFANNPMMLYFMMGNDGKDCDMLPLMLMMNGGFAAPAASKAPVVEQ